MWRISQLQHRASAAARAGVIDQDARVRASASIDVDAEPEEVWRVLADIEGWPGFVPGVTRVVLERPGAVGVGTQFRWRNACTPIRSTVEVAEPGRELTWTGTALWLVAVHRNEVTALGPGGSRLTSSESMAGVGVGIILPARALERQLGKFVAAIAGQAMRHPT
ncbi:MULTISPECIES: SRPBCC family protein [unclassified Luteococcus]|uniref:SRPBCC family protein n=1 Tax=unclassified Luteococcus TaxID=2639923 RepID=UPI00313C986F